MKKWIMLVFLVWGAAGGVRAQGMVAPGIAKEASRSSAVNLSRTAYVSPDSSDDFSSAAAGSTSWNELGGAKIAAPRIAGTNLAAPVASAAMAAPAPQVIDHGTENDRWELGLGFTYVKFRSPAIDQNMLGLNTSVVYFPREWIGVEGNITAVFGGRFLWTTGRNTGASRGVRRSSCGSGGGNPGCTRWWGWRTSIHNWREWARME
jgi:hypothetical protein